MELLDCVDQDTKDTCTIWKERGECRYRERYEKCMETCGCGMYIISNLIINSF